MTNKVFDNKILKHIRVDLGLSQKEFAKKLGTTQQTLTLVESGKRGVPKSILGPLYREFGLIYVNDKLEQAEVTSDKAEPEYKKSGTTSKKYKVSISLDICSPDETSAMTCVLNAMSRTGKCLVNKIEIL